MVSLLHIFRVPAVYRSSSKWTIVPARGGFVMIPRQERLNLDDDTQE